MAFTILLGLTVLDFIDQNNILHVLINNSESAGPTRIIVPILNLSDNSLQDNHIIFSKKVLIILRKHTQHAQFQFRVQFPLKCTTEYNNSFHMNGALYFTE